MNWTRSETLPIAATGCTTCHGLGLRNSRKNELTPCDCVFRAIFRICFDRFRECVDSTLHVGNISLDRYPGKDRKSSWGRKLEEFAADFVLVTKRNVTAEEYRLFRYHFLLGADWRLCCRKLNMDRGNFFHAVYRLQQKLGRIYAELQPYALYPLSEYFNGEMKDISKPANNAANNVIPIRPPVKAAGSKTKVQPEERAA